MCAYIVGEDTKWVAMCSKNSGKAPNNVLLNGQDHCYYYCYYYYYYYYYYYKLLTTTTTTSTTTTTTTTTNY